MVLLVAALSQRGLARFASEQLSLEFERLLKSRKNLQEILEELNKKSLEINYQRPSGSTTLITGHITMTVN